MSIEDGQLDEAWRLRNAAAETLAHAEDQMRRCVRGATVEQLVAMLESYSPARSTGPEWTRTFEPLVERLWTWRDEATIAKLAAVFQARGPAWASLADAFAPENGVRVRASVRHPSGARLPAFVIV